MDSVAAKIITPDDMLAMPDEKCYELVNGELVEKQPRGGEASWVQLKIGRLMAAHCEERNLGWAFSEAAYTCFPGEPNKVRRPDLSFVKRGRLPGEKLPKGYISIPPDIAVEVISPKDLAYEVEDKVLEYLHAGVQRVWLIYPDARTVHIRSLNSTISLRNGADLTDEDVLPGFRHPVSDFFPPNEI